MLILPRGSIQSLNQKLLETLEGRMMHPGNELLIVQMYTRTFMTGECHVALVLMGPSRFGRRDFLWSYCTRHDSELTYLV